MEPTDDEGMIARFIKTKGEGIHHVAFSVDHLSEEVDRLKEKGCQLINDKPLEIFGGKVSFLHPKSVSGVAIELVEYPQGWKGWIIPRSEKEE
jgi:methylmalonyl-CoA epimerase